jgi:phospholipid/cholesterol/gamma-HCH transport system substrate-binding protein
METKANYVAVGVFVLSCMVALVVSLLWLAGAQYADEFAVYRTYFQGSVTGLGAGTIVRYNGIDVGNVREVNFDSTNPRQVIADLQINPEIQLREDAVVSLEAQGLTGGIYVQITGGTPGAGFLEQAADEEFPVISSRQSAIQLLFQETPELLTEFTMLAQSGVELLNEENRTAFSEILVNMRDITDVFADRNIDMAAALELLPPLMEQFNSVLVSVDQAMAQFESVATSVDQTAQSLTQVAVGFDEAINQSAVPQIDQLLVETRALVASLGRLSEAVERQPTQLLFGDRREGYAPQ